MKKLIVFSLLLLFTSCNFPTYFFEDNYSNLGLNFQKGKWILGEIDTDFNSKAPIKKIILEEFSKFTPNRVFYTYDVKGIITPKKVAIEPSKTVLKDLKIGTNFDFFINVKSEVIKNNLDDIDLTNHNFHYNQGKTVRLFFEIYDLNTAEIIYTKKVIGSIKIQDNNKNDINFSKSISKLTIGCLEKVMKDIKKKSVY